MIEEPLEHLHAQRMVCQVLDVLISATHPSSVMTEIFADVGTEPLGLSQNDDLVDIGGCGTHGRHVEPFVIGETQIVTGNRPGLQPRQRCPYGTAGVGRSASSGAGIDAAHAVSSPS